MKPSTDTPLTLLSLLTRWSPLQPRLWPPMWLRKRLHAQIRGMYLLHIACHMHNDFLQRLFGVVWTLIGLFLENAPHVIIRGVYVRRAGLPHVREHVAVSGSEPATPGSLQPCGLDLSPAEERTASPVAPARSRAWLPSPALRCSRQRWLWDPPEGSVAAPRAPRCSQPLG